MSYHRLVYILCFSVNNNGNIPGFMLDDVNIIKGMNYISVRLSPLIPTNRRVLNMKTSPNQDLDDIGNIDYTGIETKHEEYSNKIGWDHHALPKHNRFPHFPPILQGGNRRHQGEWLKLKILFYILEIRNTVVAGSQLNQSMGSKKRAERKKNDWLKKVMLNTVVAGMDTVTFRSN